MVGPLTPMHSHDVADGTDDGQRATPSSACTESLTDRRVGRTVGSAAVPSTPCFDRRHPRLVTDLDPPDRDRPGRRLARRPPPRLRRRALLRPRDGVVVNRRTWQLHEFADDHWPKAPSSCRPTRSALALGRFRDELWVGFFRTSCRCSTSSSTAIASVSCRTTRMSKVRWAAAAGRLVRSGHRGRPRRAQALTPTLPAGVRQPGVEPARSGVHVGDSITLDAEAADAAGLVACGSTATTTGGAHAPIHRIAGLAGLPPLLDAPSTCLCKATRYGRFLHKQGLGRGMSGGTSDIWEANAERFHDATAQVQGQRRFTWAGNSIAAPRRRGGDTLLRRRTRTRWRTTSTTVPSTSSRCLPSSRRASCRSEHELPLRRRRTCMFGRTPTRSRSSSAALVEHVEHVRSRVQVFTRGSGRRRHRPVPRAVPFEQAGRRRPRASARAMGTRRRRSLPSLHRRRPVRPRA